MSKCQCSIYFRSSFVLGLFLLCYYLCIGNIATQFKFYFTMSKGNMLLGYARGKVGSMVFARRAGEQITRPYNGNPKNPKTLAQMRRRIKWANLINSWRRYKPFIQMGMQSRQTSQSDYNKFVSLNLNQSLAYLLKEEAAQGAVILADYILTSGTLGVRAMRSATETGITVGSPSTDLSRISIGELSANIMALNQGFAVGDQIAVLGFGQGLEQGVPQVDVFGFKFLLTAANDGRIASSVIERVGNIAPAIADGYIAFQFNGVQYDTYGGSVIQSRISPDGQLLLSDSRIMVYYSVGGGQMAQNPFSVTADEALASYGFTPDVYLSPTSLAPIVTSVTIDGSEAASGSSVKVTADSPVLVVVNGRGFDAQPPIVSYGGVNQPLTNITPTSATLSVTPTAATRPLDIKVGGFVFTVNLDGQQA